MRFAIIGIGNIAPIHAAAIRGVPGAELVAVATRQEDRGRAFAAEYGGTWYADYRELLAQAQADVVTICTPHDLHAPMTLAAAAGRRTRVVRETDGPQHRRVRCDDRRV